MIFVFGSNLRGIHGAGAAKYAHKNHGARLGYGEGMVGNSYALPTKWSPSKAMTLNEIQERIATFLRHAARLSNLNFKITQIGCGLGGWTKEDIAPLFRRGPGPTQNCYFDEAWKPFLPGLTNFWGSI